MSDKTTDGKRDIWACLDARTGRELWALTYPAQGKMDYTNAPRATPVVDGSHVYLFGALGDLHCVSVADGAVVWNCNVVAVFGGKIPEWGFCGTPLLVDRRLVLGTSASEAALVAFDAASGRVLWKTPGNGPGYGNLIVGEFGGRRQLVGLDAASVGGWDPETGERLWTIVPPEGNEFNVPTPVAVGGHLLVTTERNGTRLYAFGQGGLPEPDPVAENLDIIPDTTSAVTVGSTVWCSSYGGLSCLDASSGLDTVWRSDEAPFCGHMSLFAGGTHVLAMAKTGQLVLLPAQLGAGGTPSVLAVFGGASGFGPEVWSHPALVGNRLYIRTASEIVCLRLD